MIKVYVLKKIEDLPIIPILFPNWGIETKSNTLFLNEVFEKFTEKFFEIVEDIEEANYILIPHNYFKIKDKKDYLEEAVNSSKENNKKIIIYAYGDSSEDIDMENSIILRSSRYKKDLRENEIIIPAYAPAVPKSENKKKSGKPIIGFVGWAGFRENNRKLKAILKDVFESNPYKKNGVLIRNKILKNISKSKNIENNFIIRDTFSRHSKTISLDPQKAREEFINNIYESDLLLSVKGDGNFSVRFFEVLSAGRIPLFIDTDCSLPLENEINYDDFILRVDLKDLDNLDKKITNFWNKLGDENYIYMQNNAAEVFRNRLEPSQFFKYLFSNFDDIVNSHEGDKR